ncbi:hypothetical protein [Microbacterium sp. NPDC058345]|uniref:hypothetical protein n=1 Tax=Microbacterium sp. NPDC058345 TaxID=3346455 RepID=UPI00364E5E7F
MSIRPVRVAFAGLAHSHPFSDAGGVQALGGQVVAVHDSDADAAAGFAERFGGVVAASPSDLLTVGAEAIIATPRPHETGALLDAIAAADAAVPVFFNKVVAAGEAQFDAWEAVLAKTRTPIGTASVLRFAPALARFGEELADEEVVGVRVHAQHDNAGFQLSERAWQDDPAAGGGTLVTVGVHAWEMIDRLLPGAVFQARSGWTRRLDGSTTRSEDAAGVEGVLQLPGGDRTVAAQVLVTGVPGPDRYAVDAVTAGGLRTLELALDDPLETLGFRGLIRALLAAARHGGVPAPWAEARIVVRNSIHAAAAARSGTVRP